MSKITSEILAKIAPYTPKEKRDRFLPHMNEALPRYGITTELRVAAFLATCCFESDYFKATAEYGKGKGRKYGTPDKTTGKIYYGRGIIQNTWKDAYVNFTKYVKSIWSSIKDRAGTPAPPDFVNNPDLLATSFWAVEAACWFWKINNLNALADKGKFFAIQGLTNRGNAAKRALDYDDRLKIYDKLLNYLPDNFSLVSAAVPSSQAQAGQSEQAEEGTDTRDTQIGVLSQTDSSSEQPPSEMPESLTPQPTSVVEVEQVTAASDPPKEDLVTRMSNRFIAIPAMVMSAIGAAVTWATSAPLNLILVLVGAALLIAVVYMVTTSIRNAGKEKRETELKRERERQAFELQKLTLESAMSKDLNTVRIVPTPIANSDNEKVQTNG